MNLLDITILKNLCEVFMDYKVTFPNLNVTMIFKASYEVYCYLVTCVYGCDLDKVDEETHIKAADAQGWCELASAGDSYDGSDFSIECVYSFNA